MLTTSDIIALKSLQGIGDQTIRKIIRSNKSVEDLKSLSSIELKHILRSENDLLTIKNNFHKAKENAEFELEKYSDQSISIISYFDNRYPNNLSKIEEFPILLFCKGNIDLFASDKNIAIIGTRDNSQVGQRIAKSTASYFAQKGFTIVSGLAKGIDAIAHEATLDVGGKTIAVLVDIGKIYPKENFELAKRILNNSGLLVSENAPGSFQNKTAFVLRDRIQSGLSLAIFPIETDVVGGTMHTVSYAKKQNRLIFVPDIANQAVIDMYKNNVGMEFSKINGIRALIQQREAIPYTKDSFIDVESKLKARYEELNRKSIMSEAEYIDDLFSSTTNSTNKSGEDKIQNELASTEEIHKSSTELVVNEIDTLPNSEMKLDSQELRIPTKNELLIINAIAAFKSDIERLTDLNRNSLDTLKILETVEKFYKDLKKTIKPPKRNTKLERKNERNDDLFAADQQ